MPNTSSLHVPELFEIKNVEVFATGKWNGREISDADLDELVDAYSKTKDRIKPPLKLGHNPSQPLLKSAGLSAAGWMHNLRKVGNKLVADFSDISKNIYNLIQKKAYRRVSVEVFKNVEFEGEKFPQLVGAVALLGDELPAVNSLADIMANYGKDCVVEKFASEIDLDILEVENIEEEIVMPNEKNVEVLEFKLSEAEKEMAALKADKDKFAADFEAFKADLDALKNEKAAAEKRADEAVKKVRDSQINLFVTEMTAEKLIPKSAEALVKALFSADVEKYSVGDKEYSKQDLFKEVCGLVKEAAKVNFSEKTAAAQTGETSDPTEEELAKKAETYALENKCSYRDAVKAVTAGIKRPAKKLTEE